MKRKQNLPTRKKRESPKLALHAIALTAGFAGIVRSILGGLRATTGIFAGLGLSTSRLENRTQ